MRGFKTKTSLAHNIGCSIKTISLWENGKSRIPPWVSHWFNDYDFKMKKRKRRERKVATHL